MNSPDRKFARQWARDRLNNGNFCILYERWFGLGGNAADALSGTALANCRATLAILRQMAQSAPLPEVPA